MLKFRNWLVSINQYYNHMREPDRFIIMLALMLPGIILIALHPVTHPVLFLLGIAYLLIMLVLRLLGMRWMEKR